ncbi:PucR family transcriptional regulator [Embleya hyalina]|uniref:PucR family transcriptional regulator n=1 Tax=Embleya hyalina TaxID=516124 RepID=A0A401YN57_9ACTN|nr:PucR family transcriptional regulator [Embleya hyalina]GCD96054.1 PucR family transcriptional regulator [Embleya hyalina]
MPSVDAPRPAGPSEDGLGLDLPVDPSVPGVPLSVLLADPTLGLRQIAGPREDRPISSTGVTELEDPTPYLIGGELLLTAGVPLPKTPEGIDAYAGRIARAGAGALGFGLVPVYDDVPTALIEACDRHELPLLRVPDGTPFVAVSRAAHAAMAESRYRDLRRVSRAQGALVTAAVRADALRSVLDRLSVQLDAWTVLLDPAGNELVAAGVRPEPEAAERLRGLMARTIAPSGHGAAGRDRVAPSTAADHVGGLHLTVHVLPGGDTGGVPPAIGVVSGTAPTAVQHSVTAVAAVLLSLLTSPRHALGGDSRSSAALVRLMLGGSPQEVASLLMPSTPGAGWVVVRGRLGRQRPGPGADSGDYPVQLAALGTALATPYLDLRERDVYALVPTASGSPAPDPAAANRLGWTLGFSAPSATVDLAVAANQAERALRHALAEGIPNRRHRDREPSMHSLVSAADAGALARARFAGLVDAPSPGYEMLLETLRTWLAHHGSWDRTAAALDLHRNTVRQRIAKIGDLLDLDLHDPDVRMELWFALRWLPGERPSTPLSETAPE